MYFLYFILFCNLLCTDKYIVNLSIRSGGHSIQINTSFGESVKSIFLYIFHSLSPWTVIQNSFWDIIFLLMCKSFPVSSLICCFHRSTPAGFRNSISAASVLLLLTSIIFWTLSLYEKNVLLLSHIIICICKIFIFQYSFCALYSPGMY
jgi:hypothetical protein